MRLIVADFDGRRRSRCSSKLRSNSRRSPSCFSNESLNGGGLPIGRSTESDASDQAAETRKDDVGGETGHSVATGEIGEAGTNESEPLLSVEEQRAVAHWRNLIRFQPPVVDFLMAQVLAADGKPKAALERLERVRETHLARPGLFLQTARLYTKLGRWEEAELLYAKALEVDPDNPHAHLGMCRMHLRRRDYAAMANAALETLQRLYHYPLAHFYLGVATERDCGSISARPRP